MSETLSTLKVGERGKIVGFKKMDKTYRQKLLTMGLSKGQEFSVTRMAPLGDPVEINIRGYALSLRKDEAESVEIEKI